MSEDVVVSGEPVKKEEEKKPEFPPYHNEETARIAEDRAKERTGTIKATVTDVDPARIAPPVVPGEVVRHVPKTIHDVAVVPGYATKEVEYENTPFVKTSGDEKDAGDWTTQGDGTDYPAVVSE